jgi:hypothetical protein
MNTNMLAYVTVPGSGPSDVPKAKRERIKTDEEDRGLETNPGRPGNEGGGATKLNETLGWMQGPEIKRQVTQHDCLLRLLGDGD